MAALYSVRSANYAETTNVHPRGIDGREKDGSIVSSVANRSASDSSHFAQEETQETSAAGGFIILEWSSSGRRLNSTKENADG